MPPMKAKRVRKAAKKRVAGSAAKKAAKKRAAPSGGSGGSVEAYLAGIPESSRRTFEALRAAVRQAAPRDVNEVRSYGILALRMQNVLVWYAAFAKHCSLFPTAAVLDRFRDELTGYTVSKGTVRFPLDESLPVTLVKKLVRARTADVMGKR